MEAFDPSAYDRQAELSKLTLQEQAEAFVLGYAKDHAEWPSLKVIEREIGVGHGTAHRALVAARKVIIREWAEFGPE